MSLQSPPYVVSAASSSAALFRQALASSFSRYGVLDSSGLRVLQQGTPGMSVIVDVGRAIMPGTQLANPTNPVTSNPYVYTPQGAYFALNDAQVTVTIAASNPTNPRIDAVYVAARDAFYSGAFNDDVIAVATGVASGSPAQPAIPANAILLATIAVGANVTTIVTANISNFNRNTNAVGLGGIMPVVGGFANYPLAGQVPAGSYVDDSTYGLQRWDGASWTGDQGWITSTTGFAGISGSAVTAVQYRVMGNAGRQVSLYIAYTLGSNITVPASGNIVNTAICSVPSALIPALGGQTLTSAGSGGMCVYSIGNDGVVAMDSTTGGNTLSNGDNLNLSGVYFL